MIVQMIYILDKSENVTDIIDHIADVHYHGAYQQAHNMRAILL